MQKSIFQVEGMMCSHCEATVKKAVSALGVASVDVDLPGKSVTCCYDAPVTAEKIKTAIENAGYEVV